MPPRKKTLSGAFRRHAETFEGITWDEPNRQEHLDKHGIDFFITLHSLFDWARVKKRRDSRYSNPDRFQAIVALRIAEPPPIFFVVYARLDRRLHIISVRFADEKERSAFYA